MRHIKNYGNEDNETYTKTNHKLLSLNDLEGIGCRNVFIHI